MQYRSGSDGDFNNIETFVWQAIFPAFNHPDLNEEQREENDAIVEKAQEVCLEAVSLESKEIIIAYDNQQRRLAGYIIVDRGSFTYPEIVWIVVSRKYWGTGVADELMRRGIEWLGTHKPIKTAVHYYLDRAMAFFERYGFENTGEPAGEQLIPRILLIREAGPLEQPEVEVPEQLDILPPEAIQPEPEIHNPLEPDDVPDLFSQQEPAIIDAVKEGDIGGSDDPLLSEKPVVVKIEHKEPEIEEETGPSFEEVHSTEPEKPYSSRYQDIEFEIDYGEEEDVETERITAESEQLHSGLDFEFAFTDDSVTELVGESPEDKIEAQNIEKVEDTATSLAEEIDTLELEEINEVEEDSVVHKVAKGVVEEDISVNAESPDEVKEKATNTATNEITIDDLRRLFQDEFMGMITDLFGNRAAPDYWLALQRSDFKEVVERSLRNLMTNSGQAIEQLMKLAGDLTEYFVVESASELHGGIFPQRLLRYQTMKPEDIDVFAMINDYLKFDEEREKVDSDFITIAPRRLRNATKNFLLAGPEERIFYLIDQSLMGNLKNGFAFTDKAFYWKSVLQPNHVAYYKELKQVKLEGGAVMVNGHFFDTGKEAFNLKVIVLLKKLSRIAK